MHTGPEHYALAEGLLEDSDEIYDENRIAQSSRTEMIARAQVHATLALAAATALGDREHADWFTIAGHLARPSG